MNYRFYYSYKANHDTFLIAINPSKTPVKVDTKEALSAMYDENNELIGINIFNFSRYAKIHHEGVIWVASKELLDLVNNVLTLNGLNALEPLSESGIRLYEVQKKEEHPLSSSLFIYSLSDGVKTYQAVSGLKGIEVGYKIAALSKGFIDEKGVLFMGDKVKNVDNELLILASSFIGEVEEGVAYKTTDLAVGSDLFY